jgi:two-component system, cell cycle sensor histidine kinase and response regulator CckA
MSPVPRPILVVDDEPTLVHLMARILMLAGHHVRAAFTGQEAMTLLANPDLAFACVVTDLVMPGVSGIEVGMQAQLQGIPVVYVSGFAHTGGIGRILAKPFTEAALLTAVRSAIWQLGDAGR